VVSFCWAFVIFQHELLIRVVPLRLSVVHPLTRLICTAKRRTIGDIPFNGKVKPMSLPESSTVDQVGKTSKSERLEARLSREQKELLQWAADLEGRSLTDFVVSHAQNAALQTISEHTVIKLSRADSIAFAESLQSPPELSDDAPLARAISRYKQSQGLK
jgi:uncharacterized protein (DUF1778 family)